MQVGTKINAASSNARAAISSTLSRTYPPNPPNPQRASGFTTRTSLGKLAAACVRKIRSAAHLWRSSHRACACMVRPTVRCVLIPHFSRGSIASGFPLQPSAGYYTPSGSAGSECQECKLGYGRPLFCADSIQRIIKSLRGCMRLRCDR